MFPLFSLDSLLFCLAAGPLLRDWPSRLRLAFAFGLCDGAASLIGPALPLPEPPAFALYLGAAFLLGLAAVRRRGILYGVPVILSLDNLAGYLDAGDAILAGIASSALALLGLAIGGLLAIPAESRLSRRTRPGNP